MRTLVLLWLCAGATALAPATFDTSTAAAQTAAPAQEWARSVRTPSDDRLRLCLDSWDSATHMSKREWEIACRRTVKEDPDAYR